MVRALVTGLGVVSAVGSGIEQFREALWSAKGCFGVMQRAGRQCDSSAYLGAEIASLTIPEKARSLQRHLSWSAKAVLATVAEAFSDADLQQCDLQRIGLVIGGSNLQQRELVLLQEKYRNKHCYVPPNHAVAYMDTDLAGWCSQVFGLRGGICTLGGASASGLLAVIQAARMVQSGEMDVCIAVGGLADISYLECQAFRSLGAMGSDRFSEASAACRPFDRARDGFIYGEACAAVVVEAEESAQRRRAPVRAGISGWNVVSDANRYPDPSMEGEVRTIRQALTHAGWQAAEVDYVNPHGSGSVIGDETELAALCSTGLDKAWINATKSITGHGLSAAGAVETVATILQMQASQLHPTRNLDDPIKPARWVRNEPEQVKVRKALKLSFGFGGINSALCLQDIDK